MCRKLCIGVILLLVVIGKGLFVLPARFLELSVGIVKFFLVAVEFFLTVIYFFLPVRQLVFCFLQFRFCIGKFLACIVELSVCLIEDLVISAACTCFQCGLERFFHRFGVLLIFVAVYDALIFESHIYFRINFAVPAVCRHIKISCHASVSQRCRAALKVQIKRGLAKPDDFVSIIGKQIFRVFVVILADSDFFADVGFKKIPCIADAFVRLFREPAV